MTVSFLVLSLCFQIALGLRAPATARLTPAPKARLQFRDSPTSTCNMSPPDGLPPFCLRKFTSMSLSAPGSASIISASLPATVSCEQQNEDPDQGINDQGCICTSGTVTSTMPILATGVMPSSSCGYTALNQATGSVNLNPDFGPPVTNTVVCQICSPIANNGQTCTSLASCYPKTPTAIIQIGTSLVPLGTLTAAELSTSLASAISKLCPSSSWVCDESATMTISKILYVSEEERYDNSEVLVHVPSSHGLIPAICRAWSKWQFRAF